MKKIFLALMILMFAVPAWADTIISSDRGGTDVGYCDDAWLFDYAAAQRSYNYGGHVYLYAGDYLGGDVVTILRFGLSDVPDGSDVTAVSLVLYQPASAGTKNVIVYEMADANNNWVEGTTAGGASEVDACCWKDLKFDDQIEWSNGATWVTTGNWQNTAFSTVACDSAPATRTFTFNADGIQAVEDRLTDDDIELVLISSSYTTNYYAVFDSSESETTENRPRLSVTSTPPPSGAAQVIMFQL